VTLRVTVWNEFRHEKQNEQIGAIYPDGMHTAIANRLGKESDIEVRTATLDEPEHGLTQEMDFPIRLTKRLQKNRDVLSAGLSRLGFEVQPCEGTYFLTAGITKLTNEKDFAFCERLIRDAGVALIPLSAFFSSGTPDTYVRFAFCKQQALIEQSLERLEKYFKSR